VFLRTPETEAAGAARSVRVAPAVVSSGTAMLSYLAVFVCVGVFHVTGDGIVYYRFLERLFGGHPPHPFAYQFGTAYWNAPFWAIGLAFGHPEAGVAIGAQAALAVTAWLALKLLRALDLPGGGWLLLLVVFGTPLWYYTVFAPAYSHALDALLVTGVAMALVVRARPAVIGLLVAGAITVRYANFVWVVAALLPFAARREWRRAWELATACAGASFVLFLLPVLRGIQFGNPGLNDPTEPPRHHLDQQIDVLAPAKMLFSLHRGLFLWTPLTALGVIGFVLVLRRRRELELYAIGLGSLLLLLLYAGWGKWWDGGFSFSERYLSCLAPVFAIGLAELVRRSRAVYAVAAVCVMWSVFLGCNHHYGFDGVSAHKSVVDVARGRPPRDTLRVVVDHVRGRFR
jgi:hypothetical protein